MGNSKKNKSDKLYGWRGKILYVDLTSSKIWDEDISDELINNYIGGAGINTKLFYEEVRGNPGLDPLSAENPLIFGVGPIVGTPFPCASRQTITSKSPLTGIFGDSNGGGFFPPKLKFAGYDHLVIKGKADKPVAILIEQGKTPEIIDASDMWGLDIYETDEHIKKLYEGSVTARIGPAGENLVKYANIFSGSKRLSCYGRTGLGCVMGSKKLKAVIVKADGKIPVADESKTGELAKRYREIWGKGDATAPYKEYGSLSLITMTSSHCRINNQQVKITPEQLQEYDITDLVETYKKGQTSCYKCPVACTQKWEVDEGKYKGEKSDKLEFGHYTNMGPLLGIFDFPALVHISDISNRMGMDCIQFGFNMSMAMECYQRGIIGEKETGGIELKWGDVDMISDMIKMIAKREGFGDLLAGSMPEILKQINPDAEEYAFHTKGMSFTYNCNEGIALSLASSVSTRGADHLKGHPFPAMIGLQEMLEKIFGKDLPSGMLEPSNPEAKGRVVWWSENYKLLMDCLGLCFVPIVGTDVFGEPHMLFEEMTEIFETITGYDIENLFLSTERINQIQRSFNAILGIERKDDCRRGTKRGDKDPIEHPGMLDEYYHYRGCSNNGLPTKKRLHEIGLDDIAEDLAREQKLSDHESPAIDDLLS